MNKKIRGNAITNKINNKYIIAAILVLVIVLVKTLVIKDSQKSSVSHIKRPEPGEASKNISLDVYDADGNKQTTINTYVEPRKMSEEETQQCFDEAYDELLRIMLKNNASTDYITQDICMTDKLAEGLISVSMYPSDYSVIDYDGTVHNEMLSEGDVKEVSLTYVMQYEEYERHGVIELNVRAAGEYDDESQKVIAQNTIQKVVDNTVNKKYRRKGGGSAVKYRAEGYILQIHKRKNIMVIICYCACSCCGTDIVQKKNEEKKRTGAKNKGIKIRLFRAYSQAYITSWCRYDHKEGMGEDG